VTSANLEACPGAYINIGNASSVGSCPVHNPHYDFNDAALPLGKSLRATGREKVATTIEYLKANSPLAKSGQLTLSW